jgi:hypothetical protein
VGARLLDHEGRRRGGVGDADLRRLRFEPGADQLAQRLLPGVAVALGEEVAGLLGLYVEQGAELGWVVARGPGQRDRSPDAEVVAEVGVVDRDHALEVGEHLQQPGAAAARRAEDPCQVVLPHDGGTVPPGAVAVNLKNFS